MEHWGRNCKILYGKELFGYIKLVAKHNMILKFYTVAVYLIKGDDNNKYQIYYKEVRQFYNHNSKQKYIFSPFYAFLKFVDSENLYDKFKIGLFLVEIIDEVNKYEILIENSNFIFCKLQRDNCELRKKYFFL